MKMSRSLQQWNRQISMDKCLFASPRISLEAFFSDVAFVSGRLTVHWSQRGTGQTGTHWATTPAVTVEVIT